MRLLRLTGLLLLITSMPLRVAAAAGEIRVIDELHMAPAQRAQIETEFRRWAPKVYAYLGVNQPLPVNLVFTDRIGIGYYARPNLYVPPADADEMLETWVHELAHHATGHQSNFFFKEGVATHTLEALFLREGRGVPLGFPQYGQTNDAWVRRFDQSGELPPLSSLMAQQRYDSRSAEREFRSWQVYVIAASFTAWLIRNHGLSAFYAAFDAESLSEHAADWEARWLAQIRAQPEARFDPAQILPAKPRYQRWAQRLR